MKHKRLILFILCMVFITSSCGFSLAQAEPRLPVVYAETDQG